MDIDDEAHPKIRNATSKWKCGFTVLAPVLVNRAAEVSGNARVKMTNQPHREWLWRQAYVLGRHIIGYEIQKALAAVDWFREAAGSGARIGVAGYGEGGLIALYAAALDRRIGAAPVSGYFGSRQGLWEEPPYRLVWGLLAEFGDAEIATLIAPRGLVVEHSAAPVSEGPRKAWRGETDVAAPGKLRSPGFRPAAAEFRRIDSLSRAGFQPKHFIHGPGEAETGPGSAEAVREFARILGVETSSSRSGPAPLTARPAGPPAQRAPSGLHERAAPVNIFFWPGDECCSPPTSGRRHNGSFPKCLPPNRPASICRARPGWRTTNNGGFYGDPETAPGPSFIRSGSFFWLAASMPMARPKRAICSTPEKSQSSRNSSEGWW